MKWRWVYGYQGRHTHEVKSGDTLGKLEKEYGTTVKKIVSANKAKCPKITADHIVVGWKLKV